MPRIRPDEHVRRKFLDKLQALEDYYVGIEARLSDPETIANNPVFTRLVKEHGTLTRTVEAYRRLKKNEQALAGAREILESGDEELADMARSEVEELTEKADEAFDEMVRLFATTDKEASRNVIMEIRAGTGGEEAALFAADLFGMYRHYAERQGWTVEVMDVSPSEMGGYREIILSIIGTDVFRKLRYEGGGHRVQRVPETETQGRIHTSACTVAVLPEAEEVEVDLKMEDVKMDFYRASGPGGQKVNKTSSAVRLTHIPTGIVVAIQDEKSQHKNRAKALKILRSRLYDHFKTMADKERQTARQSMIGSGDRNERIRTYNFPQNRLTDHRINLTLYNLDRIIIGGHGPGGQRAHRVRQPGEGESAARGGRGAETVVGAAAPRRL